MVRSLVLLPIIIGTINAEQLKFPDGFKFGVATASYQIEGAWNTSGKGENIWDRLTHDHPDWIDDHSNGDIACDSYHKTKEDVSLMRSLGVHFYRFSLSWSRLLPSGFTDKINPDGLRYYNELINELLANKITPMVTLYHWDLPQPLQEIGGWPNVLLAEYYEDYARFVFETFGDRVKTWITFNEASEICEEGYGTGEMAPKYYLDGIAPYLCGRTLLLAHARVYRMYDKEFRKTQLGKVGITIDAAWFEPESDSAEDKEAADICLQMTVGWWANPIFSKEGDYPEVMKQRIAKNSEEEGFPRSRLVPFKKKQVELIRGTYDFFGLNHYSSRMAGTFKNGSTPKWKSPSFLKDVGMHFYFDPKWPKSAAKWLRVVPWGFRKLVTWITNEYDRPEIIITENGYADTGEIHDHGRVNYHQKYLAALLEAIHLDGANVTGYAVWSIIDNFEWMQGFSLRFGLYYVNVTSPKRTRTMKDSAAVYKSIIKTKVINETPSINIIN